MGILARLLGSRYSRRTGVLADETAQTGVSQRLVAPLLTPAMQGKLRRPEPTPTTRPLGDPGVSAGTPAYRTPAGTPSTQRIHNRSRPGR